MKKKDLQEQAGLTLHKMFKLKNDMNITAKTIIKTCCAPDCLADDIMEFFE